MANNVAFLKGTQNKFEQLNKYSAGAFYLTEDTGRLYYANSDSSILELNQYVHQVANLNALAGLFASAKVGDFYYAIEENILCTKKEGATGWTQINRNTNDNDDTKVTEISFQRDESVTDKIKMNLVLNQVTTHIDNSTTNVAEVIGSFELTEADFNAIVDGASVSIGANFATNKATIKTAGLGSDEEDTGVSIAGAGSVTVSGSNDDIIITGTDTKYSMGSAAGSTNIALTRLSDNNTENIVFAAGQDIAVTGANANEIKIAHATYNAAPKALENQTPVAGAEFDIVSGVSLSNGHVTGVSTAKVKLPGEKWYTVSAIGANANGDLTVTVKDQANNTSEVKAEKQIYYKVGDTLLYNQGNLKDYFYTEAEIDEKLNGLNAMTYKGTVGATAGTTIAGALKNLPTSGVKIGDTYMVVGADGVNYGGAENAGAGDLLIATGTETNGVITSGLAWTYVPSANEIDTTYALSVSGTNIVLTDSGNESDIVAILGDDAYIATAQAADGQGIVISHKDVARKDGNKGTITPAAATSFDVIQEVTSDEKGHVTAVKVTTVTLPADENTTYEIKPDEANKKFALKGSDNVEQGAVSFAQGSHIEVAASANGKNIDYTITHANVNRDDGTVKAGVPVNGKFTVVTGVVSDAKGHITAAEKTEITLPAEVAYTLEGGVEAADKGVSITNTLKGDNINKGSIAYTLKSDSLKVANSNNNISIELEWGSF